MPAAVPLSIYVHLPWCAKRCPYCDFHSTVSEDGVPEKRYVDALLRDLEQDLANGHGREVVSVFLGGGTPSLFRPEAIANLIEGIRSLANIASDCEISMECNPGTVSGTYLQAVREAGITRVSIGVQSFADSLLEAIGRIHDGEMARQALSAALDVGFNSVNADLMYGLPQQSAEQSLADVETAVQLGAQHISHYQLTIESGTSFGAQPPPLPAEDDIALMGERGAAYLSQCGYQHYEVSAYARAEHRCRHNLNYWQFGDYIGIGAGAHGKLSDAVTGSTIRTRKIANPERYMATAGKENGLKQQILSPSDKRTEFLLNALRLTDGFTPDLFVRTTGLPTAHLTPGLESARRAGLLGIEPKRIRPTPMGQRYLNELLQHFV